MDHAIGECVMNIFRCLETLGGAAVLSKQARRLDQGGFLNRHAARGMATKKFQCRRARLAAGQHRGRGCSFERDSNWAAFRHACGNAGRALGLGDNEFRRAGHPRFERDHGGRETTYAGLDEDVGGPAMTGCLDLASDFHGYDAIARHHILDNRVGDVGGGVGDQDAGTGPGGDRGRLNGVVITTLHPRDGGALRHDPPGAPCRDAAVQEDVRCCTGKAGGRRHGEPVIAITGTDEGRKNSRSACRIGSFDFAGSHRTGKCAQSCIGASKGLEIAQHPTALILGQHLRDAEPSGEPRQIKQRRFCESRQQAHRFDRLITRRLRKARADIHIRHFDRIRGREAAKLDAWTPVFG